MSSVPPDPHLGPPTRFKIVHDCSFHTQVYTYTICENTYINIFYKGRITFVTPDLQHAFFSKVIPNGLVQFNTILYMVRS